MAIRCGWGLKYPNCPVEHTEDTYWWQRWEPRETGVNKETGETNYSPEFVPCKGTRAEFLVEYQAQFERYMPHIQLVRILRQTRKKQEERLQDNEDESVGISVSDYAAQIETPRDYTATCAYRAKHNCCVSVIGYKPKPTTVHRKKWGKRTEDEAVEVTKQRCDVFFGMFGANIKPTAEHYNMQREDMEHYLKYGTTLHGEWFLEGKRLPRKGGLAHRSSLPSGPMPGPVGDENGGSWTLVDAAFVSDEAAAANADFPNMEHHLELTDGSGGQFQGETNVGHIPGALRRGATKLRRHSVIGVSAHGKGIGDAMSTLVSAAIKEGVAHQRLLLGGTRNHVHYLAQHHPRPKGDVESKEGLWSPQRFFYGFYAPDLWRANGPQHFKESASKDLHSRSTTASEEDGVISYYARRAFCACPECAAPKCNFDQCKVTSVTGRVSKLRMHPRAAVSGAQTMSKTMTDFALSLQPGEFRAARVAKEDTGIEGDYWLARVTEGMTVADRDLNYAGETIKAGFLVVKAQWLQYMKTARSSTGSRRLRSYKLLPEERYLNANVFLRIPRVIVEEGAGGSYTITSDEDQRILNSVT